MCFPKTNLQHPAHEELDARFGPVARFSNVSGLTLERCSSQIRRLWQAMKEVRGLKIRQANSKSTAIAHCGSALGAIDWPERR